MTEAEKLDVYIDQTLQIDRTDPANATRVHDIAGAWMQRASEPPELPSGWRQTAVDVMQYLDVEVAQTPSAATTAIRSSLQAMTEAIRQANEQVQSLAMRDEIIKNQQNVLDAMAMLLKLPPGSFYADMVTLLRRVVDPDQLAAEEAAKAAAPQLVGPDNTPVQ